MPTGSEFQRVDFKQQDSNYRTQGEERTGEFAQNATAPDSPQVLADVYPNLNSRYGAGANPFSSDVETDPKILHEQTRSGVEAHASMNEAYGLMQPVATPGSHPWLRDDLSTTGETEAGNASPSPSIKVPMDRDV